MVLRYLITGDIWLLIAIFVFGVIGTDLVVLLAGIEDVREVLKKDTPQQDGVE